ncbi:MAG: HK97 gp10 family phage protein [Oscillospiraceae bacterium]|nr:HK97 gp10 family phage protein [Oscillospiraceae bacterium]
MARESAAEFDFSEVSALDRKMLQLAEREFPKQTKDFLNKTIGNEGRRVMRKNIKDNTGKVSGELRRGIRKKFRKNKEGVYVVRIYAKPYYAAPVEYGHKLVAWGRKTEDTVEGRHFAQETREEMARVYPERVSAFLDQYLKGFET